MITKLIAQLLQEDERALNTAKKRLARCAEGRLHVRQRGRHYRYFYESPLRVDGKRAETYISPKKDPKTLESLCNKRYYEAVIRDLEEEIFVLKQFLKRFDPQKKFRCLDVVPQEMQQVLHPVMKTKAQICKEWEEAAYDKNPYPFGPDALWTKKGELARSRAEALIANMLYDLHIPYRYECALYLEDGSVVYPDFTIMHPETLEIYYIEFFGKMDEPEYAETNYNKIRKYSGSAVFPKLIMIFDHRKAPFNTDIVMNILKTTFLKTP